MEVRRKELCLFVMLTLVSMRCHGSNNSPGLTTTQNTITRESKFGKATTANPELAAVTRDIYQSVSQMYNCPSLCKCEIMRASLKMRVIDKDASQSLLYGVDCSDTGLRQLPYPLPSNTRILKLTSNRLDVESNEFGMDLESLTNLTEMYVENNHLYSVVHLSARLPSLAVLSLARNQIDYLANSTFWGLPNLRYFSVADNQIEVIHRDSFSALAKLQVLTMSGNRISEIDVRWFRNLQTLISLDLSYNNIHTLNDWSFNYLTKLQVLDLSSNMLHSIHARAFQGLTNLRTLQLNDNSLANVPTAALQVFPLIDEIDLSTNHFESFNSGSFDAINVVKLKLNKMKWLIFANSHAFANLLKLEILEMSDNRDLKYIDRNAFVIVPKLHTLLVANSALSTLESGIRESLPGLISLDIRTNPFYCDCSIKWLLKAQLGSPQNVNLSLLKPLHTQCQMPDEFKGVTLNDTDKLSSIPDSCAPRILSTFKTVYDLSIGDNLMLNCKASGVPTPQTRWAMSSNGKHNLDKIAMGSGGPSDVLNIPFVQINNGATYSCIAENNKGKVSKDVKLNIQTKNVHIIVTLVTSSSITITWANTHHSHNYEIVYHPFHSSQNFTYRTVTIQPYMRSYTISHLRARNKYQVCIAVKYNGKNSPINCTTVTTRDPRYEDTGVHSSRNYVIIGAISVLICVIAITCLTGYLNRRYAKRREREAKLYTDSLSQLCPSSPDNFSDTMPIAYENRMAELFDLEETEDGEIHASTSLASIPSTSQAQT